MKNQTKTTEQKQKRENQLVFIEYEKPTAEGHFMTIMDSYRNVIGRVNKSFNEQSKKFEYTAFDHAGKPFSNGEKLWEVKNEFINNREELLEQAHQRRIESKEKSNTDKEQQQPKVDDRKSQMEKLREGKTGRELHNEKSTHVTDKTDYQENINRDEDDQYREEEREEELENIRSAKEDDRSDLDIEY